MSATMSGNAHLWAFVVNGDLVVVVAVFTGEKRLQGWFDLNKEAAWLG